jgi:teichuronic acid biosynthesis glycosyltransferase TuaC
VRVLVISHLYPSSADPVAGLFVHDQVRELVGLGCQVRVICPTVYSPPLLSRLRPRWRRLRSIPSAAELDGVPVSYPRYPALPRMLLFSYSGHLCYRGIRATAEMVRGEFDFDILHAHTVLPDGFAAMLLNRTWHKPLVVTIHGYDAVQLGRGKLRRRHIVRAMQATDRILCVSSKLARQCLEHHPHPDKFHVLHDGFRITEPGPRPSPRPDGGPLLLSVAHLVPLKGHRHVLQAVASLREEMPTLRYRIVGDGYLKQELEALARALGIADAVEFLGHLPHQNVMGHYAACDVFVLPSSPEGFGIVYLEAMAHGKPVIACQGEGIGDVIEHGKTGLLVPPRDSTAVAAAIRTLLLDPKAARRIGAAGKDRASQFTWRRNAERLLGIYEEVARTRRASKKSNNGANE